MIANEKRLFKVLELPKHLQTTLIALMRLGFATALEVSGVTGKARAVESGYLNQLYYMKIAAKERRGRKAFFHVNPENIDW